MFKFINTKFIQSTIEQRGIWFSAIDNLNDPFECHIKNLDYAYADYLKEKNEYFKERNIMENNFLFKKSLPSRNHFFDYPHNEFLPDKVVSKLKEREDRFKEYSDIRNRTFIFSLTLNNLSPVMWAHYGCNYESVCIMFDKEKFEKVLTENNYNWRCASVQYEKNRPIINYNPAEDIEKLIFSKHPDWSYEEEFRYVITLDSPILPKCGFIINIQDSISKVFFSKNISDINKTALQKLINPQSLIQVKVSSNGWLEMMPPSGASVPSLNY